MPTRKSPTPAITGRKAAYVARNRVALIKAAQQVLAEIGPEASIEEFAEAAQISVSTIYKHFENKEALIDAAFVEAFRDWEAWADEALGNIKDPLEELVAPMRLFLRLKRTHPLYAGMSARNFPNLGKYLGANTENLPKLSPATIFRFALEASRHRWWQLSAISFLILMQKKVMATWPLK